MEMAGSLAVKVLKAVVAVVLGALIIVGVVVVLMLPLVGPFIVALYQLFKEGGKQESETSEDEEEMYGFDMVASEEEEDWLN